MAKVIWKQRTIQEKGFIIKFACFSIIMQSGIPREWYSKNLDISSLVGCEKISLDLTALLLHWQSVVR